MNIKLNSQYQIVQYNWALNKLFLINVKIIILFQRHLLFWLL